MTRIWLGVCIVAMTGCNPPTVLVPNAKPLAQAKASFPQQDLVQAVPVSFELSENPPLELKLPEKLPSISVSSLGQEARLLPDFFGKADQSEVKIGGRILPSTGQDRFIEGAALEIEFKN